MEKNCACKGCRSCLMCESLQKSSSDIKKVRFFTFYYMHELQQAVALREKANFTNLKKKMGDDCTLNTIGFNFFGVEIIPNFITSIEENQLVSEIDCGEWKDSQSGRRKQDYGPKVNFKKQKIKLTTFTGLPPYISQVVKKINNITFLKNFNVVEQCNLEYVPERGSHIEPHFDDDWLWGEHLVTLNLLSDTWFTMTYPNRELCNLQPIKFKASGIMEPIFDKFTAELFTQKSVNLNDVKVKIPLQRRSLVILKGPARHAWKHAIERNDISSRRLCCTFRELSHIFQVNGKESELGNELLSIASSFKGSIVL